MSPAFADLSRLFHPPEFSSSQLAPLSPLNPPSSPSNVTHHHRPHRNVLTGQNEKTPRPTLPRPGLSSSHPLQADRATPGRAGRRSPSRLHPEPPEPSRPPRPTSVGGSDHRSLAMPSQRPFLSGFFAAFRHQAPSLQTAQQPNKHSAPAAAAAAASSSTPSSSHSSSSPSSTASTVTAAAAASPSPSAAARASATVPPTSSSSSTPHARSRSPPTAVSIRSPRATAAAGVPIPNPSLARRRGSDSSSEGFRDVLGADKWYVGGRTSGGEERFFKLGVMRRVRSNDGLSLDRLSL